MLCQPSNSRLAGKKDSLWVKWVHLHHLKQDIWWQYKPKVNVYWYWKKLCHLNNTFKQAFVFNVDNLMIDGEYKATNSYTGYANHSRKLDGLSLLGTEVICQNIASFTRWHWRTGYQLEQDLLPTSEAVQQSVRYAKVQLKQPSICSLPVSKLQRSETGFGLGLKRGGSPLASSIGRKLITARWPKELKTLYICIIAAYSIFIPDFDW